jgi:hypothetical protein
LFLFFGHFPCKEAVNNNPMRRGIITPFHTSIANQGQQQSNGKGGVIDVGGDVNGSTSNSSSDQAAASVRNTSYNLMQQQQQSNVGGAGQENDSRGFSDGSEKGVDPSEQQQHRQVSISRDGTKGRK